MYGLGIGYTTGLSSAALGLFLRWCSTLNALEPKEDCDNSHEDESALTPEIREINSSSESMIYLAFERFSGILNRLNPCPTHSSSSRNFSTNDGEFEDVTLSN